MRRKGAERGEIGCKLLLGLGWDLFAGGVNAGEGQATDASLVNGNECPITAGEGLLGYRAILVLPAVGGSDWGTLGC